MEFAAFENSGISLPNNITLTKVENEIIRKPRE
jgi:hypothetical protein